MPEAAMNKNRCTILRQHDIRFARQILYVKPEPKSLTMQKTSYKDFRFRVFPPNARHNSAARRRINDIGHSSSLQISSGHTLFPRLVN